MKIAQLTALIATATLAAGAMAPTADAYRRSVGDGLLWVTAKSRYGVQTVSDPTRPSQFGREVRLPGGTWIDCAGDCRETLREESIDFFYKLQERSNGNFRSR